jgi:hypothetical protein
MGNVQSIQEIEKTNQIVNEIMKFDCCLLDIGDMIGKTDYIDFITEDILEGHNVMKGVDMHGRSFIVVKAHVVYKDLFIANTFTTFFQQYKEEPFWMACSQKGRHLMETEGGMTIVQLELLRDLLYNGSVKIDNLKARSIYRGDYNEGDILDIRLGHKKDLESTRAELDKVNVELAVAKSDLQLQKQINYDLNILQRSREKALRKSMEQNKHITEKNDQLLHMTTRLVANMQRMSIPIPKPALERQTNHIPCDYDTLSSEPKTRLWANTPE